MTWNLDSTHTQIQFSVKHMMISTVRGKFEVFSAEANIDLDDFSKSTVSAEVDAASVQTGVEQRDTHLKSADFFDAENHPKLKLVSTKISRNGDDVEITADLTIRGVTKSVVLKGDVSGPAKDPWGSNRVGVSVSASLPREDFGLTWNQALEAGGVLVAKTVKIEIEAQFVQS